MLMRCRWVGWQLRPYSQSALSASLVPATVLLLAVRSHAGRTPMYVISLVLNCLLTYLFTYISWLSAMHAVAVCLLVLTHVHCMKHAVRFAGIVVCMKNVKFIILTISFTSGSHVWLCGRSIAISCRSVYLSVCLSPIVCLKGHTYKFYEIFCTWFDPSLTTVQYVTYFQFCGWRHIFRLTLWSRPNKVGLKCLFIHTYVWCVYFSLIIAWYWGWSGYVTSSTKH